MEGDEEATDDRVYLPGSFSKGILLTYIVWRETASPGQLTRSLKLEHQFTLFG